MSSDQTLGPTDPSPPTPDRPRAFKFNVSFGRKPPLDDPDYQRLLERAMKDAQSSPEGTGMAEDVRHVLSIDLSDGKLRVGHGGGKTGEERPPPTPEETRAAELWDRLGHIGTGAYPDTARMHRVLRTIVSVLGLSVPAGLFVLAIATRQSGETVFFMTLFGLVIGMLFITSVPGRR